VGCQQCVNSVLTVLTVPGVNRVLTGCYQGVKVLTAQDFNRVLTVLTTQSVNRVLKGCYQVDNRLLTGVNRVLTWC